jgi:hypothetical protein
MGPKSYDRPPSAMPRGYGSVPEIPIKDVSKEGYQDL